MAAFFNLYALKSVKYGYYISNIAGLRAVSICVLPSLLIEPPQNHSGTRGRESAAFGSFGDIIW